MARSAASKKQKEDVVSARGRMLPYEKDGTDTPPAPSFPAENSSNTETAGTSKDADKATGGAGAAPTLPLETPQEQEKETSKDETPSDTPDDGENTGGKSDNSEAGGAENGNGSGDGSGGNTGNPPADGEESGDNSDNDEETVGSAPGKNDGVTKALDLPFTVKDGMVEVVSVKRAGKSVYATTGNLITFDKDGKATVLLADALHFLNVPGFEFT
ncbi:MAG: hypothetical protein ACTTKL_09425 [Treponema sp.]